MLQIVLIVLFLKAVWSVDISPQELIADCEPQWVKVGSKCLWKSSTKATRIQNLQNCRESGASLVSPRSHSENELIKKFVGNQAGLYWLSGQRYVKGFAKFIWMDGEEIKYGDWNPGQPNDISTYEATCIQINGVTGWDDDNCGHEHMQMCEKEIKTQTDSTVCEVHWDKVGSKCLWKSSTKVTRIQNLQNCRESGASLVSPRTLAENDLIKKFIGNQTGLYWLSGQRYVKGCAKFIWMDGEEIKYGDWNPGQPNDINTYEATCIQINGITGWDDDNCGHEHMQMCEKEIKTQGAAGAKDVNSEFDSRVVNTCCQSCCTSF